MLSLTRQQHLAAATKAARLGHPKLASAFRSLAKLAPLNPPKGGGRSKAFPAGHFLKLPKVGQTNLTSMEKPGASLNPYLKNPVPPKF